MKKILSVTAMMLLSITICMAADAYTVSKLSEPYDGPIDPPVPSFIWVGVASIVVGVALITIGVLTLARAIKEKNKKAQVTEESVNDA